MSAGNTASVAAIRAELEATRLAFRETLALVGDNHWRDRSAVTRWKLGEVLAHITSYLDAVVPMALANARNGKNMPKMPGFMMNQMNYLMGKMAGRGQDPRSLLTRYDQAHDKALALLDGVQATEWALATGLPIGRLTVEQIFQHHANHFRLHDAEIRQTLGLHTVARAPRRA